MPKDLGQDESDLIGTIYEAAMEPSLWSSVLAQIEQLVQADSSNLIFFDQLNRRRNSLTSTDDYSVDAVDEYLKKHIDSDVNMARVTQGDRKNGEFYFPVSSQLLAEIPEHIAGKDYKEFLKSSELNHGPVFGTILLEGSFSCSLLAIFRDKGGAPFKPEVLDICNRFGTHLSRAIRIHHHLLSARDSHYRLQQALENTASGVALLDESGRVIFANQEAGRVCQQHPALTLGSGGYLLATNREQNRLLGHLIRNAVDACNSNSRCYDKPVSLPLRHSDTPHPLKVTALPLHPISGSTLLSQGICCVVFINDPLRKWNVSNDYMRHAYDLTPSECDVAGSLLNGLRVSDISKQRRTTEETVRWQIKNILQKTQLDSQVALLQLLMNLSCDFGVSVD